MTYDALWSLAVCNEYHMKVIEKFSHNVWSEKPIYTYLIDYGMIERLEEIIKTHLVGKTGETFEDRMERMQMICESIRLVSEIFHAMSKNGEYFRIQYIFNETSIIELIMSCLYYFRGESVMLFTMSSCFQHIITCDDYASVTLVHEKYFIAAMIELMQYGATLPENSDRPDFPFLLRMVMELVQHVCLPTTVKDNGLLPKKQQRQLAAIEHSNFLEEIFKVMLDKQHLFTKLAIWSLKSVDQQDDQFDWMANSLSFFAFASRHPPLRAKFYQNDFKFVVFLLKQVIFPLEDVKRKIGHEKFAKGRITAPTFSNTLSCINHLLWDNATADFLLQNPAARTSIKGYTLEDMCLYWAKFYTEKYLTSALPVNQEIFWGRSLFCLGSLLLHPDFYNLLVYEKDFLQVIQNMLGKKAKYLMRDLKNSICKSLMIMVRDEKLKDKIQLEMILKFLNDELKNQKRFSIMYPGRLIGTNVIISVFYDIMGSPLRNECEELVKKRFSNLRGHVKFSDLKIPKCHFCGKEQDENGEKLKRCSRCSTVWYCNVKCQKRDWKQHRLVCTDVSTQQANTISQQAKENYSAENIKERGNECFKNKDYLGAISLYEKALNLDDALKIIHILACNIAQCYFILGRYFESVVYCDKALEADKTYVKAYYRKICCLIAMKRTVEAREVLKLALSIDPNNEQLLSLKNKV